MLKAAGIGVLMLAAAASTASAEVRLTIQNGRVTLVARDATVRQVLTEWARVGQTKIVNVERIPGGPITLELTNVPEHEALDVLLRSVSGYMAAPRPQPVGNLSRYDRILVMPTVAAPRPAAAPTPVAQQPPQLRPPVPVEPDDADDDDDDEDDRTAPGVVGAPRGPVFGVFPPPQVVNPQQPGAPTTFPGVTSGVVIGQPSQPFNQPQPFGQPQAVPGGQQQPQFLPGQQFQPPAPGAQAPGTQPASPFGGVSVPGMIVPVPTQPRPPAP